MPINEPTTLATVTFEGDLRLTVLQALSIDRLFGLDSLSEYVVVLNGADNDSLRRDFIRHLDGRVSHQFMNKLRTITAAELSRGGDGTGWYGQQVIKLALHEAVKTSTYLMLDGKNHFIRPSTIDDFFHEGLPITQLVATSGYWDKYVRASLQTMDALTDNRAAEMMPTTTPYLMITAEVSKTVKRIEMKFEKPLPKAILETKGATEFFLYYAHLVSSFDDLPYANKGSLTRTLFTSWPQDHDIVMQLIHEASEKNVPMFGMHRKRLPQLTDLERLAVKAMWAKYLLKDWEDSDWFLAY